MKPQPLRAAQTVLSHATSAAVPGQRSRSPSVLALVCLLLLDASAAEAAITVSGQATASGIVRGWNDVSMMIETQSGTQSFTPTPLNPVGAANTGELVTGPSYGRAYGDASGSLDLTTLSLSGYATANVSATGLGLPVSLTSQAQSNSQFYISSPGLPFLFKANGSVGGLTAGGSILRVMSAGGGNRGWSGNVGVVNPGGGAAYLNVAGIDNGITFEGLGNTSTFLTADGVRNTNGSYSGSVELDENVVRPPANIFDALAAPGRTDAVVNYPARTTYTGLTEAQFTNVNSITYTPASGSALPSGATTVTSVVSYKWGVTITETFGVSVIPGFAPADVVRVSWNGQPIPISYESPSLPPGTVSGVSFNVPSGTSFPVGQTPVNVTATVPGLGSQARTFKVKVIDGSSWSTSGPPATLQGDTDSDWQADWAEAQGGTNPYDAADRFQAQTMERVGNDFRVSWLGTGGVTYQLQSIALTGGAPVNIGAPVTATGARQLITVTDFGAAAAQPSKFYRVAALAQ